MPISDIFDLDEKLKEIGELSISESEIDPKMRSAFVVLAALRQAREKLTREVEQHIDREELNQRLATIIQIILQQRGGSKQPIDSPPKLEPIAFWNAFEPYAVVRQYPVGHGCFHTGTLGTGVNRFHWVYDCGSWRQKGPLDDCIETFKKRVATEMLDVVFLSHFDSDHINGIKKLLEAFRNKIDLVVVPYMNSGDILAVFGRALVARRWSEEFFKCVVDPETWFRNYGAKRIVRIRPPKISRGGSIRDPDLPRPPDLKPPLEPAEQPRLELIGPNGSVLTKAVAPAGTVISLAVAQGWADWWFMPFVHPVSRKSRDRFSHAAKQRINRAGRGRTFKERLVNLLKTRSGRRLLKQLYQQERVGDSNAISLSLYEGPRPHVLRERISYTIDGQQNSNRTGWLLTGDSKLRAQDRRDPWIQYFRPARDKIGVMMLPHHGSTHNFHPQILEAVHPGAELFITADTLDKTRPNKEVKSAAGRRRIKKVSASPSSELVEISGPKIERFRRPDLRRW